MLYFTVRYCLMEWGIEKHCDENMMRRASCVSVSLLLPAWLISSRSGLAQSLSRVQLFATPWTAAHQAPLSMVFPRQEYWSGLPFPPPGDLHDPGIEPGFAALQVDSLALGHLGSPWANYMSLILCKVILNYRNEGMTVECLTCRKCSINVNYYLILYPN